MSDDLSTDEQYLKMYEAMCLYCEKKNYGDPFSYGRGKEIYMAIRLNHTISSTLAGADGYEDKELTIPAEYKATTCKSIKATYNGISVQSTWEEQVKYLKEKKICKYKNHYIARFENGKIAEMYKMTGDKVYEYLIPKLKIQFERKNKGKDPRLGCQIGKKYIIENSIKLI
jgi:hypothetical protein